MTTLTIQDVASCSVRAYNITDLATQLHCTERDLRKLLITNGYSAENIHALREELSGKFDLTATQYLDLGGAVELLEEADIRAKKHPVRHDQFTGLTPANPDKPILITFWGDWHIGEAGTDHIRLRDDAERLYKLREQFGSNLVLIGMGDYIGGYMKSKTPGNNAQVLNPGEQRKAARGILEITRPDVIIQGDHDEWHSRHDDEHEWLQEICEDNQLRYAQWGTTLQVQTSLPNFNPKILARHRFKGARGVNPYQPQIKLQAQMGPADIVALAHYHSNPGVTQQRSIRETEGSFYAVQSGTYKQFDDYGKKIGVGNGEYGVPSMIIIPEEGEYMSFNDLNEAARVMKVIST